MSNTNTSPSFGANALPDTGEFNLALEIGRAGLFFSFGRTGSVTSDAFIFEKFLKG
jgi:hypothetical protein